MKKIFLAALALALAFSLTACGGTDIVESVGDLLSSLPDISSPLGADSSGSQTPGTNVPDLGAVIGGTGKLSEMDEATKHAMIAAAQEDGGNLEFKADGSAVYTDAEGNQQIQNPDGSWTMKNADGGEAHYSNEWPENEFTKLLPKPDFTVAAASSEEDSFGAAFSGATIEQVKAYVEQIKAAGFTVNPDTQDQEVMGMAIYTYWAENTDGYSVEVAFASGTVSLSMNKPS